MAPWNVGEGVGVRSPPWSAPQPVDATAFDGRRIPGGYRFGGFPGLPGEVGCGFGGHGAFGGTPWPGFEGCPGLEAPLLGSDITISLGPPESAIRCSLQRAPRSIPGAHLTHSDWCTHMIGDQSFPLS